MPRLVESDELEVRRKSLGEALKTLNRRERGIFGARRLADELTSLEKLADEYGVSLERVCQIQLVCQIVAWVLGYFAAGALFRAFGFGGHLVGYDNLN